MISVVVTTHREGLLLPATLKALQRTIDCAAALGFTSEVLISLDRPDDVTAEIVKSISERSYRVVENDFGDPGLCRNACVGLASGDFIAVLDGDDLFSSDWLGRAAQAAMFDRRAIIWHPEINIVFGEDNHLFVHQDMEDPDFDLLSLVAYNPWTALCFGRRDLFLDAPYVPINFRAGVGHEDWAWNRHCIELGYLHKVVIGTGHAIRRKAISQVKLAALAGAQPVPSSVFRDVLERRRQIADARAELRAENGASPT